MNCRLLTLFVALGCLPGAVAAPPLVYFPLDETSGATAFDFSGNGRNAMSANATPAWQPGGGMIGGALDFTSTAQNTVTESFSYTAPSPLLAGYPFTFGGWFKTSYTGNYNRTMMMFGDGSVNSSYYSFVIAPNHQVNLTARNTSAVVTSHAPVITDGGWHHVLAVCNSATDRTFYVDGVARGSSTTSVPFVANGRRVGFGALTRLAPTDAYNGTLDDLALWGEAFTPEKAAFLHALGRLDHAGAGDPGIDAVLAVYNGQTGSANAGVHTWSYTTGLAGARGDYGTMGGNAYVVLGPAGQGVIGVAFTPTPGLGVVINELVADNASGPEDEDLAQPDWLELWNDQATPQSLAGWYLTDDPQNLTKWPLPDVTLNPGQTWYLFCSAKEQFANVRPHTNFHLIKEGGTVLLVKPGGTEIASQTTYPPMKEDVAWGALGSGPGRTFGYLETPTPGGFNVGRQAPGLPPAKPVFSLTSSVLTAATLLSIALPPGAPEGAVIRYTTNGADPNESSTIYTGPIPVSTTTVRARVFAGGHLPSEVNNRHFILLGASLRAYNGTGAPFSSSLPILVFDSFGQNIDASNGASRPYQPALAAVYDLHSSTGRASLADAPANVERSGVHVHGQSSANFPQRPYAWETWRDSADDDKNVSILGLPSESNWILNGPYFEKTLLRNYLAYTWMFERRGSGSAPRAKMVEVFFNQDGGDVEYSDYRGIYLLIEKVKRNKDRQDIAKLNANMSAPALISGGFVLQKDRPPYEFPVTTASGVPFGIYQPENLHPSASAALTTYLNDFESALAGGNFADPATGYRAYADADTFIDTHLAVETTMQTDGYIYSSFFTKDRGGKLQALPIWDYDRSMGSSYNPSEGGFVGWVYHYRPAGSPWSVDYAWYPRMFEDPEFVLRYWDRYWQLRRTQLDTARVLERVDTLAAQLTENFAGDITNTSAPAVQNPAARHFRRWNLLGANIFPNSAGWDTRNTYAKEVAFLKNWLTGRLAWIDGQNSQPPVYNQFGGGISAGFELTMSNPNGPGAIYYTWNGTDPRTPGAAVYSAPIALSQTTTVNARSLDGGNWSPLSSFTFVVDAVPASAANLLVTEIHYHPTDPTPAEISAGYNSANDFEFIELTNVGPSRIDLAQIRLADAVTFDFSTASADLLTLPPGGRMIVAENVAAFQSRLPAGAPVPRMAGAFQGNLSNGGETLLVERDNGDGTRTPLFRITYADGLPWPTAADGEGRSLTFKLAGPPATPEGYSAPQNWRASSTVNGTPGAPDATTFAEWKAAFGATNDTADQDGDGLNTVLEYVTGSDPAFRSRALLPTVKLEPDGSLTVTYCQAAGADDVTAQIHLSTTLADWQPATGAVLKSRSVSGAVETFEYNIPAPPTPTRRRFIQVHYQVE